MKIENETEAMIASFDLVARQDEVEKDVLALRSDVDDVMARLDRIGLAASRRVLGRNREDKLEVKSFVDGLRRGSTSQVKSVSGSVAREGGYPVPGEMGAEITNQVKDSPIRRLAQVVQVGNAGYRKLVATRGTASGWAGDTVARPETQAPDFAEIAPPTGELYANPAASQAMLDDAAFDFESWLATEIAVEFARAEGAAFVNGSGIDQPMGFLSTPASPEGDAARRFGVLQYIGSGEADDIGANPEVRLIDLIHTMKHSYRQGASWVMNSATLAKVRKLKTGEGSFLWQPGLVEGHADRLLGYPVVEAEDMPDIAAGSVPIAFGNFRAGYLIADRSSTQILRDPFTNKPFVHFYATKRVGGQVLDSAAIKLFRIEA